LKIAVIQAGMAIDVSIAKIYLVPPRWLIKSSAGKPSRKANKERILFGGEPTKWNAHDHGRIEAGHINSSQVA